MSRAPTSNEQNPMVVLDTNSGSSFYMRLEDAVAAVQLLARAQRIEYSWTDKSYKFVKQDAHTPGISVKALSAVQVAAMHLEEDA